MLIRTEAPADILPIDALLKIAFPTATEANLVKMLRENSRFTLSMLACNDKGKLIGYALFTPVTLNGEFVSWQALAPVATHPDYRRKGVATKLIQASFDNLNELGYAACVVLGAPSFYQKFGFQPSDELGFYSVYHQAPNFVAGAFQMKALREKALDKAQGLIEYCPEFANI